MRRTWIIFVTTIVLVLSAGVVVGRLSARLPEMPSKHEGRDPSWLADQLDLTSDQRQQMDAIWSDTKQKIGKTFARRRDLDRERDEAIEDLLTEDQWIAYGKIYDGLRIKRQELDKERDQLIHDAENRSRLLLSEQQQKKWDVLAKDSHDRRGQRGPSSQHGPPPGGFDGGPLRGPMGGPMGDPRDGSRGGPMGGRPFDGQPAGHPPGGPFDRGPDHP